MALQRAAFSFTSLATLVSFACSRGAPAASESVSARAPSASASSAAVPSGPNPFARTYTPATVRIEYESKDRTTKRVYSVKNGRVRCDDVLTALGPGDGYSLDDGVVALNVSTKRRRIVRFHSTPVQLFDAYTKLDDASRAHVRRSIDVIGPDLPYYLEDVPVRLQDRDIGGLGARCYRQTSRILGSVSEVCYWRGIQVWMSGASPIDGHDMSGQATRVVAGGPIDDALFDVPRDFPVEDASTDEIMRNVFADLVDRMKDPGFTLEKIERRPGVGKH
jgi:hypothetical protein